MVPEGQLCEGARRSVRSSAEVDVALERVRRQGWGADQPAEAASMDGLGTGPAGFGYGTSLVDLGRRVVRRRPL